MMMKTVNFVTVTLSSNIQTTMAKADWRWTLELMYCRSTVLQSLMWERWLPTLTAVAAAMRPWSSKSPSANLGLFP